MSNSNFETFYWPTVKAVILGWIEEGWIPDLFVEGAHNERRETITDLDIPAGRTIGMFNQTNLREARKGRARFGASLSSSLLFAGKPEEAKAYGRRRVEEVRQDGGYVLSTGSTVFNAVAAILHAMIDSCREYGVYTQRTEP